MSVPREVVKVAEASVFSCVLDRQVILKAEEEMSEGFFGFEIKRGEEEEAFKVFWSCSE